MNKFWNKMLLGILLLIIIIMFSIYVFTFGSNGLSTDPTDFASFGSYISSTLTFATLIVLLMTWNNQKITNEKTIETSNENLKLQKNVLELSIENNELQKFNSEKSIQVNQRVEVKERIDYMERRIAGILAEIVYPGESYSIFKKYNFDFGDVTNKKEFVESIRSRRKITVESLIGSLESCVVRENKDMLELYDDMNKIPNVNYLIKNLATQYSNLVIVVNALNELDISFFEISLIFKEHVEMINTLNKIGFIDKNTADYVNHICTIADIIPMNILEVNLSNYRDVIDWFYRIVEDKKDISPENVIFKVSEDNKIIRVINSESNDVLFEYDNPSIS